MRDTKLRGGAVGEPDLTAGDQSAVEQLEHRLLSPALNASKSSLHLHLRRGAAMQSADG